jgi:ribosome-binding ATPase
MKLGIIGLPQSGKSTVFAALTRMVPDKERRGEERIATIRVPDERLDRLSKMVGPQKATYAQIEYLLPGTEAGKKESGGNPVIPPAVRECDALIHIVRNFGEAGVGAKSPAQDFRKLDQEMILTDLVVVEKRLERITLDHQRGKKMDPDEYSLLSACRQQLENERPLRRLPELGSAQKLRGFALLTAKPVLVLFNNDDDDDGMPQIQDVSQPEKCLVVRGKLEQELAQLSAEDAVEFMREFKIRESAMERVIRSSYELLGLLAFFTIGEDEVKAWTIPRKTLAVDAAEAVHSDMKKGFIRAEVLAFNDLMAAGSYAAARKKGTVRLEGKTYEVSDGDIIHFRFNI